ATATSCAAARRPRPSRRTDDRPGDRAAGGAREARCADDELRRLAHAAALRLAARRAPRGARDRRPVRPQPHGDRVGERPGGGGLPRLRRRRRHLRDRGRAGEVHPAVHPRGRERGRPHRLPGRGGPVPQRAQGRQHRHPQRAARFRTLPNAANTAAVSGELVERSAGSPTGITDSTSATALLAVQGPRAVEIVGALATEPVEDIGYYRARWTTLGGLHVLLARTGYTGEDGFEVFLPGKHASGLWHELVATAPDLVPAGLAARDSLRLEAAMPLYGNELSRDVDPFTVGLGGIVGLKRKTADFVGREALERIRAAHLAREPGRRVLVGLVGDGRRAARQGDAVLLDGQEVGRVTSGLPSPTLGRPIALAIVDPAAAEVGTAVEADVRGRREPFTVVELPFYRRPETH